MSDAIDRTTDPEVAESEPVPPLCSGTLLALQTPGSRGRRFAELLGHAEGDYLVLRSSSTHPGDLAALRLGLGDVVMVRFVGEGAAYGFRVHVTRVLQQPELLIFTSFPANTEARRFRREERLPCMLPCVVGGGDTGLLLDLSAGGCQLALPAEAPAPELEAKLGFCLNLPGRDQPIDLAGRVRRVQTRRAGHRVGLELEGDAGAALEAVRNLVAMLQ